jgi:hypothetical protein
MSYGCRADHPQPLPSNAGLNVPLPSAADGRWWWREPPENEFRAGRSVECVDLGLGDLQQSQRVLNYKSPHAFG